MVQWNETTTEILERQKRSQFSNFKFQYIDHILKYGLKFKKQIR